MFSAKLCEDEQEVRYYGDFNATMLCESIKSTWYEAIAAKVDERKVNIDEDMQDKTEFIESLDNDKNACNEIVDELMVNIVRIVRAYLEIPKHVIIPLDMNYVASENLESLEAEVTNLERVLNRHMIYAVLLKQRLQNMKSLKKLANRIFIIFIKQTEKILLKTSTLDQMMALKDMAKSGQCSSDTLLTFEKIVQSFENQTEEQE